MSSAVLVPAVIVSHYSKAAVWHRAALRNTMTGGTDETLSRFEVTVGSPRGIRMAVAVKR
jgi:hypothetical protein